MTFGRRYKLNVVCVVIIICSGVYGNVVVVLVCVRMSNIRARKGEANPFPHHISRFSFRFKALGDFSSYQCSK